MKVLLFITGFRHVEEYGYFNDFLQRLNTLNGVCDIFIYCNNPDISADIVAYYRKFTQKNKHLLITSLNAGFIMGAVEAVSRGIEMGIFDGYDYVIHLHPDVFMTDESGIMEVLTENIANDCVFFITKSEPDDERFFSFDFFIFKPKLLKQNIFSDELHSYGDGPEHFLCDMLAKHDVAFKFIKRFANDDWFPRRPDDHLKLYHEHDLRLVRELLNDLSTPAGQAAPRWESPVVEVRPSPELESRSDPHSDDRSS